MTTHSKADPKVEAAIAKFKASIREKRTKIKLACEQNKPGAGMLLAMSVARDFNEWQNLVAK